LLKKEGGDLMQRALSKNTTVTPNESPPAGRKYRLVIDFLEKEMGKLTTRFSKNFGGRICQAGIFCTAVQAAAEKRDKETVKNMTREFCNIRDVLNNLFDYMESERDKGRYADTGNYQRDVVRG
jgi:hypothetical protein